MVRAMTQTTGKMPAVAGEAIGPIVATDADGDLLTFAIETNADPDGDGTPAFRIESALVDEQRVGYLYVDEQRVGYLYVNDPGDFDFELNTQLQIGVVASDGMEEGVSVPAQITVNVTDVNEAPTVVALANEVTSLSEDTDTSSAVNVADIQVADDALGTNVISLTGTGCGQL